MAKREVTIQVPASTSNCGAGFDTLSIALEFYNFFRLTEEGGEGIRPAAGVEKPESALEMAEAVGSAFSEATGHRPTGLTFDLWGEVPMERGLGSSAILRAGLLEALNLFHDEPLTLEDKIALIARLDNAPDNASAVFRGGFCVSRTDPDDGRYLGCIQFPVIEALAFVIVSPECRVLTRTAREALPRDIPFHDAVRSINSAAYLTAVFGSGEFERLGHAVRDFIHQPYRERLCPFTHEAIEAGIAAGGYCGWLSGSGSCVTCVTTQESSLSVGKVMREVFERNGQQTRVFQLAADNSGLRTV